jgi:hypothetical protein
MLRRRWVLAANEADAIRLAWSSIQAESDGSPLGEIGKGVVFLAPEDMWGLWASWGKRNDPQRQRYPLAFDVYWLWYRPECEPDHKHKVSAGDGKCPSIKVRREVTQTKLWNTPTGFPPRRDPDCSEAMGNGIRCAVCWHGNIGHGYAGNGLCAAHVNEDFNDYTQVVPMTCGACDGTVKVVQRDWRRETSVPCPHCPDGGVDLVHARRHADDF